MKEQLTGLFLVFGMVFAIAGFGLGVTEVKSNMTAQGGAACGFAIASGLAFIASAIAQHAECMDMSRTQSKGTPDAEAPGDTGKSAH